MGGIPCRICCSMSTAIETCPPLLAQIFYASRGGGAGIATIAVADLRDGMVLPPDAVDQRDVVERRKTVVERCSRDRRVADVVIVDESAEFTSELPPGHAGVRWRKIRDRRRPSSETERDQLVFRIEMRFRDPLEAREGKLVRLTRVLGLTWCRCHLCSCTATGVRSPTQWLLIIASVCAVVREDCDVSVPHVMP